MTAPGPSHPIRLPDGRALEYAEYGDPGGRPVLFFHGFPGSRLLGSALHDAAARVGARLIAPDRPGLGLSTSRPGRLLADYPADVEVLADTLGHSTFAVMGFSGGGPYALAAAAMLPRRVLRCGVLAGLAPKDAPGASPEMHPVIHALWDVASAAPWLMALPLALARAIAHVSLLPMASPAAVARPEVDRAILRVDAHRKILQEDATEGFRAGADGVYEDMTIYSKAWHIELGAIRIPVLLRYGAEDLTVPAAMGRYLAAEIPGAQLDVLEGEGHFSMLFHQGEGMLRELVAP